MSVTSRSAVALSALLWLGGTAAAQEVQGPDLEPGQAGQGAKAEPAPADAAPPPQPAPAATPVRDPFAAVPPAKPADVRSMDAIIAALYDVISGDAGVKRDWDRFRSLFYPGARMIPTGRNAKTGAVAARIASPDQYIEANQGFLEGEGFHEVELSRHVDAYGTIAQVFSAYEARHKLSDAKPFLRGVNSIQLLNEGKRWWVLSLAWAPESADDPLPRTLTQKPER